MFENSKLIYNKLVAQEMLYAKKKFIEGLDKNIIHNTIGSIFGVKIVKLNDNNSLYRWAIQGKDYHLHEIMGYMMKDGKMIIMLGSRLKQLPLLECKHENDGTMLTSKPPKYRCKKCNKIYS